MEVGGLDAGVGPQCRHGGRHDGAAVMSHGVLRPVAHRRLQSEEAWAARTALASHDRG